MPATDKHTANERKLSHAILEVVVLLISCISASLKHYQETKYSMHANDKQGYSIFDEGFTYWWGSGPRMMKPTELFSSFSILKVGI